MGRGEPSLERTTKMRIGAISPTISERCCTPPGTRSFCIEIYPSQEWARLNSVNQTISSGNALQNINITINIVCENCSGKPVSRAPMIRSA
jgi:hypothetical protein